MQTGFFDDKQHWWGAVAAACLAGFALRLAAAGRGAVDR